MTDSEVVNGWMEETRERTELKASRRFLLRLLHRRFSQTPPAEFVQMIETQESQEVLDDWFDSASTVPSMNEFIRVLKT